jgi:hypothetical protein
MTGSDGIERGETGQTPAAPDTTGVDRFGEKPPRFVVPHDFTSPKPKRNPPILPIAFFLAMLLIVSGLGLRLAFQDRELGTPFQPSEAENDDAGGTHRSGGDVPYCSGVTRRQEGQIDRALVLMRKTREGDRLADQLAEHDVCIGVENLAYNAGYASAQRSWSGDWGDSYIVIDGDLLSVAEPDVVAALLVHEATHVDRYIRGKACGAFDDCEVLDNGVIVEEEVAAHAAEAQWWISVYGPSGRRVYSGYGYSLDVLAAAYLQGEDAFRQFVIDLRSDPRDGVGI